VHNINDGLAKMEVLGWGGALKKLEDKEKSVEMAVNRK